MVVFVLVLVFARRPEQRRELWGQRQLGGLKHPERAQVRDIHHPRVLQPEDGVRRQKGGK
jgi:hypothetical protein